MESRTETEFYFKVMIVNIIIIIIIITRISCVYHEGFEWVGFKKCVGEQSLRKKLSPFLRFMQFN